MGNHIQSVAVMGLGYVGLPLALEFHRGGLTVIGLDTDGEKIQQLQSGQSYLDDVSAEQVWGSLKSKRFTVSTDFRKLSEVDAVCICVPTPLNKLQEPDLSYIIDAVDSVARHLHHGMLVVLESTTYPGTTEEVVLPRLESTGLRVGMDFYLAFSPERYDPGNKQFNIRNTPKVIGGITSKCTEKAMELYRYAVDTLVSVSNARTAEMVKLLENTFRAVNIALVNEMAMICNQLSIDIWEVIEAAKTKPFGFMPFYPGPGLGGHCLPIDPIYLSWKMQSMNFPARFIELARSINSSMPKYVVEKAGDVLNKEGKSIKGSKILILGVSYKKDVSDVRESPALDIISMLHRKESLVHYSDPYVQKLELDDQTFYSVDFEANLSEYDLVIIVTDHSCFDYEKVAREAKLILDTRNATKELSKQYRDKIYKI